jgi:integrase
LPYAELPAFMAALTAREDVAARALEFLILTAARSGEAQGARWSEIDRKNKVWTIPAERMKTRKEHKVPLSDQALALLERLPSVDANPHLFIGTKAGACINHGAMDRIQKRLRPHIDVHGFRSTFRTWASERTNFRPEVAEMALAHSVGNAVERVYNRTDLFDQRRRLMAKWAQYCYAPPVMTADVVVPIRA